MTPRKRHVPTAGLGDDAPGVKTRLPPDLAERFAAKRDRRGLNNAEALREAVAAWVDDEAESTRDGRMR